MMPTYDGKYGWWYYLVQFEIVVEMNCWSPKQRALELSTTSVGPARGVLSNLSSSENWFHGLCEPHSATLSPWVWAWEGNKSKPELVQKIGKLTHKTFPSADENTRSDMSVISFKTTLLDEQQELFVYQRVLKSVEESEKADMAFESYQADWQQQSTPYVCMQKESKQSCAHVGDLKSLSGLIARNKQFQPICNILSLWWQEMPNWYFVLGAQDYHGPSECACGFRTGFSAYS